MRSVMRSAFFLTGASLCSLRELLKLAVQHENVIADRYGEVEDVFGILTRKTGAAGMSREAGAGGAHLPIDRVACR